MAEIVYAFTPEEEALVGQMLTELVRALRLVPGGGKIEEDYWSHIYYKVRQAERRGWSNLSMRDFCEAGLGVEMKLLQRRSPLLDQKRSLMHPAATRAIAFDPQDSAEECKRQILRQFGALIEAFRKRVRETCSTGEEPLIRWGVFLWSRNLSEFLYFEEAMTVPNPDDFYAEFVEGSHRGKPTQNLFIYEKATQRKRYSVTMPDKGTKLQPYFDVPRVGEGAYAFQVPDDGRHPLWVQPETLEMIHNAGSRAPHRDVDALLRESIGAWLQNQQAQSD